MTGWLRWLLAGLPLGLGLIVGLVLWLAVPGTLVQVSAPPATVAVTLGLLLSSAAWAALALNALASTRRDELRAAGARTAREEHAAFLARLDHELKNPLTAIRAALAAHGTEGSPHLAAAEAQSARLGGLVGDLRKLSDLRTRPLEREPVELRALVDDAVAAVQQTLAESGSRRRLWVDFAEVPWRVPEVSGDPDLLYLAVFNLLANAAKFTTDGDSVQVRATEHDGWVTLEVADTGRGIPAEELAQVWDELARATNARGVPGTGLGLPLVKVVAERHGGRVSVRSRLGHGTSVKLELPVRPLIPLRKDAPVQA